MSVTTSRDRTEVELLHFYFGRRISEGDKPLTIEQALQDYSEYRLQLDEFRCKLREAEETSARGQSRALDLDAAMDRVCRRLEKHGVA